MGSQPQAQPQPELLSRASAEQLAELLKVLGDPHLLLKAGLRLAMQVVSAKRGLAFDTAGQMASAGMTPEAAETIRKERLGQLLVGAGVRCYSGPGFADPVAEGAAAVAGMAGVIGAPGGASVLAVECDQRPFDPTDQQVMAEMLHLLAHPFAQSAAATRHLLNGKPGRDGKPGPNGEPAAGKLSPAELPLDRLEPFPLLQEMERLLIREALTRSKNNRTRAAAALGLTREGLRKKLNRYGIGS